ALVDVFELQRVRDQVVDVDLAVHVPVDDLRHVGPSACPAERRALPYASGHKLEGTGRDLLPCAGDTDDDADAPTLVAAFEGLAHRLDVADAFEAVIGTALGQVDQIGHEIALDLL